MTKIDDDTSKRIAAIRIILTVLVVFIHNNNFGEHFFTDVDNPFEIDIFSRCVRLFLSHILSSAAVPLFFLISGYLTFSKDYSYKTLLKKKLIGLVIPYLLWNTLIAMFYFIVQVIPSLSIFVVERWNNMKNFGVLDWLQVYIVPICGHFWFVGNLIIVTLLTPIIKKLASKLPLLWFALVLILYVHPITKIASFFVALFYYTLGLYVLKFNITVKAIDKIEFFDLTLYCVLIWGIHLYSVIANVELASIEYFTIFASALFLIRFVGILIQRNNIYNILNRLSYYSFWLYAIHTPVLQGAIKAVWKKYLPYKGGGNMLEYFCVTTITIALGISIGAFLNKFCPLLFNLFNGSRAKNSMISESKDFSNKTYTNV